jgi:pimeloyl-ACP methyl ester carboxylesterase
MLSRLANKLILQPSCHPIVAEHKLRELIEFNGGHVEVWRETNQPEASIHESDLVEPAFFVLKFPGTGGRAERGTCHPAEIWDDVHAEVWTVNPPGYGGSSGPATIRSFPEMARTVFERLRRVADGRPIVVTGNSLGNISALYVAATYPVDALLLRNPPPLRELIVGKHSWWNFGLARFIAQQVPKELCSITNASASDSPALFLMSGQDRMVPPHYQQQIIDAHAGEKRVLLLPEADHATPITEEDAPAYLEHLSWLRSHLPLHHTT